MATIYATTRPEAHTVSVQVVAIAIGTVTLQVAEGSPRVLIPDDNLVIHVGGLVAVEVSEKVHAVVSATEALEGKK